MLLGIGSPKTFNAVRCEARTPMEVGVRITGHSTLPGTENTFTENVSLRGARVLTTRRWKTNEQLEVTTLAGSFRSVARVAYCCRTAPQAGFAIGLEFGESSGNWVLGSGPGQVEPPPDLDEELPEILLKRNGTPED